LYFVAIFYSLYILLSKSVICCHMLTNKDLIIYSYFSATGVNCTEV